MRHVLTLALAFASVSSFAVVQRSYDPSPAEVDACKRTYAERLNIRIGIEADRVCANYPRDILDCAVGVNHDFGTQDHRAAISLCTMKFSDGTLRRCAIDAATRTRSAGQTVDLARVIDDCRAPRQRVDTSPPPARRERFEPSPARPPVSDYTSPRVVPSYESALLGKIAPGTFRAQVAKWINQAPESIRDVHVTRYFGILNQGLESLAVALGRPVRLHRIAFAVLGKQVSCVATEFTPPYRYLVLDECVVNGQAGGMPQQFGALNYEFINQVSDDFKTRMNQIQKAWSGGAGNVSFRRDVSDFLVIGY